MAEALIGAMLGSGLVRAGQVICSDVSDERLRMVAEKHGVRTTGENGEVFRKAEIVFLAFKPQNFPAAVEGLEGMVRREQLIISIMAGVRMERIRRYLPGRIVRVMPNTACLVGKMAGGYTVSPEVEAGDRAKVQRLLEVAGTAVEVTEEQLDAVTGLSGSGPAFVSYLIEAFIEAGMAEGLTKEVARRLALETFVGTAVLLEAWELEPEELIKMVSSPNGTTVAGRAILEDSTVKEVIVRTIRRATQRSRELS